MPRRGSPYGPAHQRLRQAWAPRVATGLVHCASCHQPIKPGQAWDLGHSDDRTYYIGPEHVRCNRAKGWAKLTKRRQIIAAYRQRW